MSRGPITATAALVLLYGHTAAAQTVLTLEDVIARARERAGSVTVARARIAEAEAAVVEASARSRQNPLLEASGGPRSGRGERSTDLEIGASQLFETGGQRDARIAAAAATVDRERAVASQTSRQAVFDAASAFVRGVAAGERLRIAEEADTIARETRAATERRYKLGDIAAIDVNLAQIAAARTTAELRGARADLAEAVAAVRALLRISADEVVELRGALTTLPLPPLPSLQAAVANRPEFLVLDAEAKEAEAQLQLGRALGRPDIGVRVAYEREESSNVLLGGLSITLPTFQRGQGTAALGAARAARVRVERETTRDVVLAELTAAHAGYEQRAQLVSTLEQEALLAVADNESLARRSYEVGELNLMEFLLIRRDALQTRILIVERKLDAALGRLLVDYLAGVLQ
jgi:cobalt-zinc-cadmium efflux system outer membrane protein